MGKKRTRDGKEKLGKATAAVQKTTKRNKNIVDREETSAPVQSAAPSVKDSGAPKKLDEAPIPKKLRRDNHEEAPQAQPAKPPTRPNREKRQKQQKLPDHVSISKRPLLRPPIPSPFSNSDSPKTLYITHTSPFIPTIKRIRRLLSEITNREQQSLNAHVRAARSKRSNKPLQASGHLKPEEVEKEIVEASREKKGVGGEEVYVKATGRAIERALQIGVHFQGESDCTVKVEMGSIQAIDDIEIKKKDRRALESRVGEDGREAVKKDKAWKDEDIPETRIRTLSSITVIIGLK